MDFILGRVVAERADFKHFGILDLFAEFITIPLQKAINE